MMVNLTDIIKDNKLLFRVLGLSTVRDILCLS